MYQNLRQDGKPPGGAAKNPFISKLPLERAELAGKALLFYAKVEKKVAECTGDADAKLAYLDIVNCHNSILCAFSMKGWTIRKELHYPDPADAKGVLAPGKDAAGITPSYVEVRYLDLDNAGEVFASGKEKLRNLPSFAKYDECWSQFSKARSKDNLLPLKAALDGLISEIQTAQALIALGDLTVTVRQKAEKQGND